MSWPFEHWDNGKVYLHNDNWAEFRREIERKGHPSNRRRFFLQLHTPRDTIADLPVPGDDALKHSIVKAQTGLSVVLEPYPAFVRTHHDPEGWLPSWHLWLEDRPGEPVEIYETGEIYQEAAAMIIFGRANQIPSTNTFAKFRGKYWRVRDRKDYGYGTGPKETKKFARDINEPFEAGW